MATTVEIIKDRLGIHDVLSTYLKIEKAGINYKARCPFHQEKTPSFFISPSRNTFYCFGCGAKGDIFEFVERFEGLDFKGALKLLAERANVPIVYEKQSEKDEREKLFAVLEDATSYFENNLVDVKAAKDYLLSRGLKEETIKKFRLGYSLPEWRALSSHLQTLGHSAEIIEKSGLTKPGPKGNYDRFRGRIIFPINDASGRVVAYSARIFDQSLEGAEATPGKYINSPETPLYRKSKILYGFDKAKEGIRKWTFAILVEGQMDLLLSHQADYSNTVALSGTALTLDQLTQIKHLTNRLVLSLDADAAGLSASGKSAALALREGFDVKVAHLKGNQDPADIILENGASWKETIKKAKHVIEFYLDVLQEKIKENKDLRAYRLLVSKTVLPYIKILKSAVDKAHFISLTAERLQLPESAIEEELKTMNVESFGNTSLQELKSNAPSIINRQDLIIKYLMGLTVSHKENEELTKKIMLDLKEKIGEEMVSNLLSKEDYLNEAAYAVEELKVERPPDIIVGELMLNLKFEIIKEQVSKLKEEIKASEKNKEESKVNELMKVYQELSKELSVVEQDLKKNDFSISN